jgi:hypothetical protein
MKKLDNGYFIRSFNQWGNKTKCGCIEFSFYNTAWFASKFNLVTLSALVVSIISIVLVFIDESKLKFPVICVLTIICLSLILKILFGVKKETLHVIAPIGVQFITSYIVGKESVWFLPWHALKNFVIVEVIVGQQIFFYLGLQNKANNNEGLVILFQKTRPRLHILEEMYKDIVGLFLTK